MGKRPAKLTGVDRPSTVCTLPVRLLLVMLAPILSVGRVDVAGAQEDPVPPIPRGSRQLNH